MTAPCLLFGAMPVACRRAAGKITRIDLFGACGMAYDHARSSGTCLAYGQFRAAPGAICALRPMVPLVCALRSAFASTFERLSCRLSCGCETGAGVPFGRALLRY